MRVLALSGSHPRFIADFEAVAARGIDVRFAQIGDYDTGSHKALRKIRRYLPTGAPLGALRATVEEFRPDIIHCGFGRPVALWALAAVRGSADIGIVFEHGAIGGLNVGSPIDWLTFFNPRIAHVVVPSLAVANIWAGSTVLRGAMGDGRCMPIPHAYRVGDGVDATERAAIRRELGFADDEFVVGTVCHNRPIKNLGYLARVVARLGPPFVMAHVGGHAKPGMADRLRAIAGDRLRLLGHRPDAARINCAFDVYASPTRSPGESFGFGAIEAMGNGVPVITAPVGGTAQFVSHQRSGLVLPLDDALWAGGLRSLADDRSALADMGVLARQTVASECAPALNAERFEALYRAMLAGT